MFKSIAVSVAVIMGILCAPAYASDVTAPKIQWNGKTKDATYGSKWSYGTACIDGVEYIILNHIHNGLMAPHFKPDGSLYLCK